MKLVIDTHVWIWWNMRPEALSPRVRKLLGQSEATHSIYLSAISLWEFCKLLEKGRLTISCPGDTWIREALHMPGLQIAELTPEIAYQSTILPKPVHDDPADQMIIATARALEATLITKDDHIRAYPHVKTIWS